MQNAGFKQFWCKAEIFRNYDGIIVIGFSGNDSSVMNLFNEIPKGKIIYWCFRSGEYVNEEVKILVKGEGRYLVEIDGFDEIMNKVRQHIGITNKQLALNYKNNLDKITNLLSKFEDDSNIDFLEEIANNYRHLTLHAHARKSYSEKDYKKAEEFNRRIIKFTPHDYMAYDNLGLVLSNDKNRLFEAEKLIRKAIELNPQHANAYNNLGVLLSNFPERKGEEEENYRKAIKLDPNSPKASYNLAISLIHRNIRLKEAEQLLRTVIKLSPSHVESHSDLGALLLKNEDDVNEAENLIRRAIKLNPKYAEAYNNLGIIFDRYKNNSTEAEKLYRLAIELIPDYAGSYSNLGALLEEDKSRLKEAEELYRKAIQLNPNESIPHFNLGVLLSKDKSRVTEAEETFRKAIELNPDYAGAHQELGNLLYRENKLSQAIKSFKKSFNLDKERSEPLIALASICRILGNREVSQQYVSQAKEILKEGDFYNLACLYSILDNKVEAFMNLKSAVEKDIRYIEMAKTDRDLDWIRDDPQFKEIVGESE